MVHILIVDDDEDLLDMVTFMIRGQGMRATGINRASKLIPTLEANQFDLILMDIFLGTDDGRELAKQVKSDDRFHHLPVILYSAGNIDFASLRRSMADDFIPKPFDMKTLLDKIRGLIGASA